MNAPMILSISTSQAERKTDEHFQLLACHLFPLSGKGHTYERIAHRSKLVHCYCFQVLFVLFRRQRFEASYQTQFCLITVLILFKSVYKN